MYFDRKNNAIRSTARSATASGKPTKGIDMNPYWKAEAGARKASIGMWSLGDKYISPKEWRRMKRK